ncbi:putative uncharacterized protein DDB_G0282133 isoform X2 [Adelges cooleyi]|uniref:putative uncharacterized protein DDB_G0282133 isoform X2 n=1 Tax=Adelges cooleyi TaxID=133065 RepID=UPI0021804999|nr:putative uncharacterized protein DDB_G0282133 isoform X2 [Adelges cooleyi]
MECCGNPSDTLAGKEQFMVVGNITKTDLNESSFQLDDTRHQSILKTTAFQKKFKLSSHNFSNMFDNIFDDDSQMEMTQNSTSIKPFHKRKRLLPPSDNNDFSISSKCDTTGQDSLELSIASPRLRFSHRNKNNSKADMLNYSMSSVENGSANDDREVSVEQRNKNLHSDFKKPIDISSLVVDINTNDNSSVLDKTNLSTTQTITDNSNKVSDSSLNNTTSGTSDMELNSEKTMFNNSLVSNINQISMCSSIDIPSLNHTYDIQDNCNSTRINSLHVSKSNKTMNINSQETLNNETYVLENTNNKSIHNTEKSISDSSVTSKKNVLSDTYTVENNKNETYSVPKSEDKSSNNSTKMLHDMSNIYDQPKLSERKPNFIRKLQLGTEVMDYNIESTDVDNRNNTMCDSVNETGHQSRKFKPKKNLRNAYSAAFDNIINKTQDDNDQTMNESVKMSESLSGQQQLSDSILITSVNKSMVNDVTNSSFIKDSNVLLDAAIEKEITIPESSILLNYNIKGHSSLRKSSSKFNFSRVKDKDLTSTLNFSNVSSNSPKRLTSKFDFISKKNSTLVIEEAQDNDIFTISVHSASDLMSNTSNNETKLNTHNLTAVQSNESLMNGLSQTPAHRFTNKHNIEPQSEVFNNLIDDSLPCDVSQDMSKRMKFNRKEVLDSNSFMFDGIITDSEETKSVLQNEPIIKQDSPVDETAMAESNICDTSRNRSKSCMETEENSESQYQLSSPGLSQTPKNRFVNKPSIGQQSGVFSNLIDDSLDSNDLTQDMSKHIKFNRRNVPDNSFMFDGIITNSQESNTTKSASLIESNSIHEKSDSYACETDEHFSNESTSGKEARDCFENQCPMSLANLSETMNTSSKFPEPKNTTINDGEVSQRVRKKRSLSKSFSEENKTITNDKSDNDVLHLMNNTSTFPFDGPKDVSFGSDQSIRNDVTGISLDYEYSVTSRKQRSASKSFSKIHHRSMSRVSNRTILNKTEPDMLSLNNTSMFSTDSSNTNSDTNVSVNDSASVTSRKTRSASRSFTKDNNITMSGVSNKTINNKSEPDMLSLNNTSMLSTNNSNINSDTNNVTNVSVNDGASVTGRKTRSASRSFTKDNNITMSGVSNKTINNKTEPDMLSLNNTSMLSTNNSNINSDTNNVTNVSVNDGASVTGRKSRSASRSFTKDNNITMSGVSNKTINNKSEPDMLSLNNTSMLSTNNSNINSDTNNVTNVSVNDSASVTSRKTISASRSFTKDNNITMSHVSNNTANHNKSEYDLLTLNNTSMLSMDSSKSLTNKRSIPADVDEDKDISPSIGKTRSSSKSFSEEINISPMSNKTITNDRSEYELLNSIVNEKSTGSNVTQDLSLKNNQSLNLTTNNTIVSKRLSRKNRSVNSILNKNSLPTNTRDVASDDNLSASKDFTRSTVEAQSKSFSQTVETLNPINTSLGGADLGSTSSPLSSKRFSTKKNLRTPDSIFSNSSKRQSKSLTVQSNSVRLTRSLSKKIKNQATISYLSNISLNNVSGNIKSRKNLTQNSSFRKSTRRTNAENELGPFITTSVSVSEKEMRTARNTSLNGSVHSQSDDSMLWATITDDDTSNISCASNVNGTPVNVNKTIAEHINNAIGLMSARKRSSVHPAVFELEDLLTRSFRRVSSNGSPSILTRALGRNFSNDSLCSSMTLSDSIDQQTCVEDNVTMHFKSLYNKEPWITKRLYNFLVSKLEPKYNIYSMKHAEKFVKYLASVLKEVRKENVDLQLYTNMLRYHMARYGMIIDTADYIGFLCDYIPKLEFDKLLPGWDLATSEVKFDPYKTHVPLMEDKDFLNEVFKHLNC